MGVVNECALGSAAASFLRAKRYSEKPGARSAQRPDFENFSKIQQILQATELRICYGN